ncbi:MAG: hypothetical protein J6I61_03805, partial [Prevotella sp.]|nr:hypothetical protein [Prevotella sp.]
LESLSKYMPTFSDVNFEEMDGDYVEFVVDMADSDGVSYEELLAAFEEWKRSLPEKDTRHGTKSTVAGVTHGGREERAGMFQILSQVMSYPLESRTPSENAEFISLLKRQLADLL